MEVFGYTRISVDLDEDSRENTSIENQKKIIRKLEILEEEKQKPDGMK